MEFKIGDKVILVNKASAHYEQEGVIVDIKTSSFEGTLLHPRYIVDFINTNIRCRFICSELDLENLDFYIRDKKLNQLGI